MNKVNIIDTTTNKIYLKNVTVKQAAAAIGVVYSSVNNAVYRDRLLRGRYKVETTCREYECDKRFSSIKETEEFKRDWDETMLRLKKNISESVLRKIILKKVNEDDL